jgi:probable F420-dependent oxidoreductase
MSRLGKVGVWIGIPLGRQPAAAARETVAEIEELGYGALWTGEAVLGKEAFSHASLLLAAGRQIVVATGIASIWARDPIAMATGARTIAEAYPGRFVLGMGVSHAPLVSMRGQRYDRPVSRMREYLEAMDAQADAFDGPAPAEPMPRVLAALRPPMIELARERADGVHPYFVPVEHTRRAREILGESPLLLPEQAVLLETDPAEARRVAREHASWYLGARNYVENLRWLGFAEDDLVDGGSDALIDAIVAWGDEDAILERLRAHLDAGADHVCIQPLTREPGDLGLDQLRRIAAALPALS